MSTWPRAAVGLLAAWCWLATGAPAFAARLLNATIELNGQRVQRTYYQDNDMWSAPPGPPVVWRYLGEKPLWAEKGASIKADPADALKARLEGALVIRFQHGDRPIVEAKASELSLMRSDPASDLWFLPKAEVERLALANGIPSVPAPSWLESPSVGLAAAAMAAALVAFFVARQWLLERRRIVGQVED